LDKGKAAAVKTVVYTKEKSSGRLIFENQSTVFLRGSGGFGGKKQGKGECSEQTGLNHNVNYDFARPWSCQCQQCPSEANPRCGR
jgi:hypothetical protein